jgi:hypothetical protein
VLLFLEGWHSRRLSVSPFNEVQLWLLPKYRDLYRRSYYLIIVSIIECNATVLVPRMQSVPGSREADERLCPCAGQTTSAFTNDFRDSGSSEGVWSIVEALQNGGPDSFNVLGT